jgi:Putative adhesin
LGTRFLVTAVVLGAGCPLHAADAPPQAAARQKIEVSNTRRVDFPAGGTLRFRNSVGVLTVEAWDRTDVEITTIKSTNVEVDARDRDKATHDLERVNVATELHGNELIVSTTFPAHRPFGIFYPLSGRINFDLEYRIKAPANARIIADHTLGQVNIDGLTGDIQVNLAQGEILLHLPEDEKYSIHAKSDFGNVNSDFSDFFDARRRGWLLGHRSVDESSGAHKLDLKVGFGDIVILKINVPKSSGSAPSTPKTDGL